MAERCIVTHSIEVSIGFDNLTDSLLADDSILLAYDASKAGVSFFDEFEQQLLKFLQSQLKLLSAFLWAFMA